MQPFCRSFARTASVIGAVSRSSGLSFMPQRAMSSSNRNMGRRASPPITSGESNYCGWTRTNLIKRIQRLENELQRRPTSPKPEPKPEPDAVAELAPAGAGAEAASGSAQPVKGSEPQDALTSGAMANADSTKTTATAQPPPKKKKVKGQKDPSKYSTRYIALKLAYLGKNYGGFEFQATANHMSVEEELWTALTKACLIFPKDDGIIEFDCCEYSKCGRTDKGVSAFGQVIGLRVRSNKPLPKQPAQQAEDDTVMDGTEGAGSAGEDMSKKKPWDPIDDEIHYPRILNRILPPDIRILAWCPDPPPDFSARFSCRERQYRYFFTQPAFTPEPSSKLAADGLRSGYLDIDAMRRACKLFEGEHDFRNFCRIDPAKQITAYERRMYEADIVEVEDVQSAMPFLGSAAYSSPHLGNSDARYPKVYSFNVRGSAFLWHQIRHMVSVLFLIGQRLEEPSLVSDLLDVKTNPGKPSYNMADEIPLVLWDCIFPTDLSNKPTSTRLKDGLHWVYTGEGTSFNRFGQRGVLDSMWQAWREKKVDELLTHQLLQQISLRQDHQDVTMQEAGRGGENHRLFEGSNKGRLIGKYVPVMKRGMQRTPDEQNDMFAKRKGYTDSLDMRAKKGSRTGKHAGIRPEREDEEAKDGKATA